MEIIMILIIGMLSPCFSDMDAQVFNSLPNSTNAVESHNRFGRSTNRLDG